MRARPERYGMQIEKTLLCFTQIDTNPFDVQDEELIEEMEVELERDEKQTHIGVSR